MINFDLIDSNRNKCKITADRPICAVVEDSTLSVSSDEFVCNRMFELRLNCNRLVRQRGMGNEIRKEQDGMAVVNQCLILCDLFIPVIESLPALFAAFVRPKTQSAARMLSHGFDHLRRTCLCPMCAQENRRTRKIQSALRLANSISSRNGLANKEKMKFKLINPFLRIGTRT